MKRAVIVHCWGGRPNYAWYPWAKKELENRGYQVDVPTMPDTDNPKLSAWLRRLKEAIGEPDEALVLVGHSLGVPAILRYLETLDQEKIGQAVFVAGFTEDLDTKELENFFETPLDFQNIKPKSARGFVAIQSDNDPYVPLRFGTEFVEELNAKLIIKHNANHMSGEIGSDEACVELPELMPEID
ncbi:MAG: serine hydrolase family protein [Gammaproteobacteria bacterium]|nr:serine hydrolase family protein [Gammaproteobacteria bacterium]